MLLASRNQEVTPFHRCTERRLARTQRKLTITNKIATIIIITTNATKVQRAFI
jgi:hypothetical protein